MKNCVWNFIIRPDVIFFITMFCLWCLLQSYCRFEYIMVENLQYKVQPEVGFPIFSVFENFVIEERGIINNVLEECDTKYDFYTKCYNKEYNFSIQRVDLPFKPRPKYNNYNNDSKEVIPYHSPLNQLNPSNPLNNPQPMRF